MNCIREYLVTGCGGRRSFNSLLLEHGQSFPLKPLPKGIRRGRMKMCYANAGRIATGSETLIYCEGLAVGSIGIPMEHAWLMDSSDGHAFDPTWKDGVEYFGLPIRRRFLCRLVVRKKTWCVMDWKAPEIMRTTVEEWKWKYEQENHLRTKSGHPIHA